MTSSRAGLRSRVLWSVVGWLVVIVFFFPVLWMWLESLKTETQAASSPPTIFFTPTLEEFQALQKAKAAAEVRSAGVRQEKHADRQSNAAAER